MLLECGGCFSVAVRCSAGGKTRGFKYFFVEKKKCLDFGGGVRERVCKTWGFMLRGWYPDVICGVSVVGSYV